MDEFFKANGPINLFSKLKKVVEAIKKLDTDSTDSVDYFADVEEICELFLNITEQEKGRISLKDQPFLT